MVFQQNRVETIKNPGLLQPLAIPSQHWEDVLMDFIIGLLKFEGKPRKCCSKSFFLQIQLGSRNATARGKIPTGD